MGEFKYRAFLSYSHRDERWARWLHKSLEAYRPPKTLLAAHAGSNPLPKRLSPVFRDREELPSATDLGAVISEALNQSACQIVICSPNAARSRWVNEEILAFKRLGREGRIFCLIVDGEPNASDIAGQAEQECFPHALRYRLGSNGELSEQRSEPIAADAREGKDGKRNALLKLIAGILGVGFDALKRREQHRHHQRLALTATGALAGMVITTGLAGAALIARENEQRERIRAEAEAETARQTTSFLIDLFRINDPSEARGKKITALEMLDKGTLRIQTELTNQPAVQATLMDTLGRVYVGLGLYGQAKPLLEDALERRRKLSAVAPSVLSDSLNHVGDLLTLQAQYDAAEKAYREAVALAHDQPDDPQSQSTLATGSYGLGVVLAQQGRYPDAERTLRDALARQQQLFGETHGDIARTLQSLGRVSRQSGDLQTAISLTRSVIVMHRKLYGTQPHPFLAEAINDLGVMLGENSEYDSAEQLITEAIAMKRVLLGDKHPEVAMGLNNLAHVLHNKGDLSGAESHYRQALAMQRELLGNVHPDVADTLNNLAFVYDDRSDLRNALRTARESLAIYRELFPGDHPQVARIMNRIGYWLTSAGEYAQAERELRQSLQMRRRLLGENHLDVASSLTHLAILQVATHEFSAAQESARKAAEISASALSASHWRTAVAESAEGAALTGMGKYPEAEKLLVHSFEILKEDLDALPTYRALARTYLEQLYRQSGRPRDAHRYGLLANYAGTK